MSITENILVIGGGRWAKTIIEVILDIIPESVKVFVFSPHNSEAISVWLVEKRFNEKVFVETHLSKLESLKSVAVIVANATRDHEKSVRWAISMGFPVLVEKPVTATSLATSSLIEFAKERKTILSAAHVFRFASYLEKFSHFIPDKKIINQIKIIWMDAKNETRYGNIKKYDSSLPIITDLFPHIFSILISLDFKLPNKVNNLTFARGGASISLEFTVEGVNCEVELTRNGSARKRIVEVNSESKKLSLDFSVEPGIIYKDSLPISEPVSWDKHDKPLVTMLSRFLSSAAGDQYDSRLGIDLGLYSNQIIDEALPRYHSAMLDWIIDNLGNSQDEANEDLLYAVTEILQVDMNQMNRENRNKVNLISVKLDLLPECVWLNQIKEKVGFNKNP